MVRAWLHNLFAVNSAEPGSAELPRLRSAKPRAVMGAIQTMLERSVEIPRINGGEEDFLVLAELLASCPVECLPRVDALARIRWFNFSRWWWKLEPSHVPAFAQHSAAWAKLSLASFHQNGRIREAAVHELAKRPAAEALPLLLVRMNDWVQPIRLAATTAVQGWIDTKYAQEWVEALPLVLHLRTCERVDHTDFIERIITLLQQTESRPAVREGLTRSIRSVGMACLRVVEATPASEPPWNLEIAPNQVLPSLAARVLRYQAARTEVAALPAFLRLWQQSKSAEARREVVRSAAERLGAEAKEFVENGLLDRHAGVREVAQFSASQVALEPAAFYRTQLRGAAGSSLAGVLCGLGQTGEVGDYFSLQPYLRSAAAKVHHAALMAAVQLAPAEAKPLVNAALGHDSRRISRWAAEVLARQPGLVDAGSLAQHARAEPPHVRLNVIRVVLGQPYWESFTPLLTAVRDPEELVRTRALHALESWREKMTHRFLKPAPEIAQRATAALALAAPHLPVDLHRELAGYLQHWSQ